MIDYVIGWTIIFASEWGLVVLDSAIRQGSCNNSIWVSELGDLVSAPSLTGYYQPSSLPALIGSQA